MNITKFHGILAAALLAVSGQMAVADSFVMPDFDAAAGRALYGSKGCVVCHQMNGIGGDDAPDISVASMTEPMNPFDFAARMWKGAGPMIMMQDDEIGGQIQLTGSELANIIAFVHSAEEQAKFSEADISPKIQAILDEGE